jgi:hypothetical protein
MVAGAYFFIVLCNFWILIPKMNALAVSHLTVALGITSFSRRSTTVINSHLLIDQADRSEG